MTQETSKGFVSLLNRKRRDSHEGQGTASSDPEKRGNSKNFWEELIAYFPFTAN
jgi:hypothetical protein